MNLERIVNISDVSQLLPTLRCYAPPHVDKLVELNET
jgi:hypothetical protein